MTQHDATTFTDQPISWTELHNAVTAAGDGLYLATVGRSGLPHVAFISPGWAEERLWIATFATSQKATNLRANPNVALTAAPSPEVNLLIRATARLVTDAAETRQLWDDGVLPYDPNDFFSGPTDPLTLFVELIPTTASINTLWPSPAKRWTAA